MKTTEEKKTSAAQGIDVKSMPAEKINGLKNEKLKKIASSVNDSSEHGTAHRNHNSGGGGGGTHSRT